MDNFDDCILLENKAFFCSFSYEVQDFKSNKTNLKNWKNLKQLRRNRHVYNHNLFRHGICVPKKCPNITKTYDTDPRLYHNLKNCYNNHFKHLGLTGEIIEIHCETSDPKYPMDWWDITIAIILTIYLLIILITTLCDQLLENSKRRTKSKMKFIWSEVLDAFSVSRNWNRFKVVNINPDAERLRGIHGLRFYTMILVILTHTVYILFGSLPVSNVKGIETLTHRFAAVFLTSGPICISTFFMLSSFFLMHRMYTQYINQSKIDLRVLLVIFINRYIRLTPCLAVVIAFQSTWLRHLGSGPNWSKIVGNEYLRCRQNGWKNIFYINNLYPESMCLQTTWYLALDTQYFLIALLLIWFLKKFEKYIWMMLGSLMCLSILISFYHNYLNDFPAVMIPTPELLYDMKHTLKNKQWYIQYIGFFENMAGTVSGLGVGYLYFKYREQNVVDKNYHSWIWWVVTHGLCYGAVIVPGFLSLSHNIPYNTLWMSIIGAVSRPCFALGMSFGLSGIIQGFGGVIKRILEWSPIYALGRLTYTAYLVHIPLLLIRAGTIRSPVYFNEFSIVFELLGTLTATYIVAIMFTLFFEMPLSQLQKRVIPQKYKNMIKVKK